MSVYLTTPTTGEPLATFSQGNSQFSSGGQNGGSAQFGQPQNTLFGPNLNRGQTSTTPAAMSTTRAGSTTNLGFTDPLKSAPGAGGGSLDASAPPVAGRQLNATKDMMKADATPAGLATKPLAKKLGPQPSPGEETVPGQTAPPHPAGPLVAAAVGGAIKLGQKAWGSRNSAMWQGASSGSPDSPPSSVFGATGAAGNLSEDQA